MPPAPRPLHLFLTAFTLLTAALVAPFTRDLLRPLLLDPILAQADPSRGLGAVGYTPVSLAIYAVLAALALWAFWDEAGRRPDALRPTARTLLAAAPLLAWAPLAHALHASGRGYEGAAGTLARVPSTAVGVLLAEPVIYATAAAILLAAGFLGHVALRNAPTLQAATAGYVAFGLLLAIVFHGVSYAAVAGALLAAGGAWSLRHERREAAILAVGTALVVPALGGLAYAASAERVMDAVLVVGFAAALALAGWGLTRVVAARRPRFAYAASVTGLLCFGAHALDASTTWLGVVDPFGWGFGQFSEKNPVSDALLGFGAGLPFVLVKLLLPAVALWAVADATKAEESTESEDAAFDPREAESMRVLLALAIFVFGFGPGASNLARLMLLA